MDLTLWIGGRGVSGVMVSVLMQSTAAPALALLITPFLKHRPAVRQAVLSCALLCVACCPVTGLALSHLDVTSVSIPSDWLFERPRLAAGVDDIRKAELINSIGISDVAIESASSPRGRDRNEGEEQLTQRTEAVASTSAARTLYEAGGEQYLGFSSAKQAARPTSPTTTLIWVSVAAWLSGVVLLAIGVARSWWKVRNIVCGARLLDDDRVESIRHSIQTELGLRSFPRVTTSKQVTTPVATGILWPIIMLPEGLTRQLNTTELRVIVLHEAAHIARRDPLMLFFQQLLATFYWPHPLIHLLNRQLTRAREEVCDNYVLRSVDGPSYGEALLRLARLIPRMTFVQGAVTLFHPCWNLEERISGFLDERRRRMVRANMLVTGAIFAMMSLAVIAVGGAKVSAEYDSSIEFDRPTASEDAVGKLAEHVVAEVNGKLITYDQLAKHLVQRHGEEGIETLVNRTLLDQACHKNGISISKEDMDAEVRRIAANSGLSVAEWYSTLERERNLSREQYRNDVIWASLVLKQLAERHSKDLANYFKDLKTASEIVVASDEPDLQTESSQSPVAASTPPASRATDPRDAEPRMYSSNRRRIAFVNVQRVLKSSEQMQVGQETLQEQAENLERSLRDERREVQALKRALEAISNDSSAKPELEAIIGRKQAAIDRSLRQSRKSLLKREATMYHDVYRRIYDEVSRYAREHHIELVMRDPGGEERDTLLQSIDPATIDADDRQSVLRRLNQHVLYVRHAGDPAMDITDAIIDRLRESERAKRRP